MFLFLFHFECVLKFCLLNFVFLSDEPELSSSFSFKSPISWRGDGKYFATLSEFCNSSKLHKRLKVWERDSGTLQASSELKAFMGAVLEWMPSGAKIAAVYDRKSENKCPSIVFYERNGLERSSFDINEQIDSTVELLKWNCTSDRSGCLGKKPNSPLCQDHSIDFYEFCPGHRQNKANSSEKKPKQTPPFLQSAKD